ncbi:MAG TPA: hypothetical protein VF076_07180 [Acidimicrobiales bacterium]
MSSIGQAGSEIMKPVTEQVASAMRAVQPAPTLDTPVVPPRPPEIPQIKPWSLGTLEDWGMGAPKQPAPQPQPVQQPQQAPQPVTPQSGGFRLPDIASFLPGAQAPATAPAAPATTAGPPGTNDIAAYIRQAAAARGIDPETAVRVAMSEGGLTDPVRQSDVVYRGQREQSYGPFQLNVNGGLGSAALQKGIDPRNPEHWRQGVDFALDQVATGGWEPFHGAARVGIGPREGIGPGATPRGVTPQAQAQAAPAATAPLAPSLAPAPGTPSGVAPVPGTYRPEGGGGITVNQLTQGKAEGLSTEQALAVCGPAATLAFAKANGGRMPTLTEAKDLASRLGLWSVDQGMGGPAAESKLLDAQGIPHRLVQGADEAAIASDVQAGKPVIVDTSGHYYVIEPGGYDPQTHQFDFGESAKVLKASGGRSRYRLDELASLGMGAPRSSFFLGAR